VRIPFAAGSAVTGLPMALTRLTACRRPSPRPRKSWS
ncbi:MAG: Mobile element protein, partial [Olavius algarvensis Gamma 1 endosymbiont]